MSCRIPYDNLKTLFIKSINYDRETYRYYRNSINSIMKMPIKTEAKVHAIWFMGIVYNQALNIESSVEKDGIVTEGLPMKIADLVKDKFENPSTDYEELLKGIESLLTEKVSADEADLDEEGSLFDNLEKTYGKDYFAAIDYSVEYLSKETIDAFKFIKYLQTWDLTRKGKIESIKSAINTFNTKNLPNKKESLKALNAELAALEGKPTQAPVSTKFDKKNIFTVTPQQGAVDRKAAIKASIATQYIGFGEGIRGSQGQRSSTEIYREQAGNFANTGNYSANDVIFVSIPGKRGAESKRKEQQDKTIKEAIKALEAGATILTDNKSYIDSSDYNEGEKRLYQNLKVKGYNYSEITVDGQIIGTWSKPEIKVEKPLTTVQKLNKIFIKLTKGTDATLNNLFNEFEDIINKDATYDNDAKIKAYDKFLEGISKLKNTSATSLRALIDQKKNELSQKEEIPSSLINVRSIPVFGDMQYVRKKNGEIKLLIFKNNTYFTYDPAYNGENEDQLTPYTVEPTDYVTPVYGKDNLEVTNSSGSEYRLNGNIAKNGIGFEGVRLYEEGIKSETTTDNRTGNQKISDNLALGSALKNQIKIVADRRRVLANRARINMLNDEGYDVTFENSLTPSQFDYLLRNPNGGPVVTNLLPRAGLDIIISSLDNQYWDYIMSADTLGFVYPDGTTRFIDWNNNDDLKLFKEAVRIKKYGEYTKSEEGEPVAQSYKYEMPTDEEIQNLKKFVSTIKEMKSEISEILDEDEVSEIPYEIFSKYFSVANVFSSIDFIREKNSLYKPVQTLDSFKSNLVITNSVITTKVGQMSAGKAIPSTIKEENVIGIVKRDPGLGFTFEPSIEQGYSLLDENNNEITYQQLFEREGLSTTELTDLLNNPVNSRYGFFYLVRTKNNKWVAKPMYNAAPITQVSEVVNFLSVIGALKEFRPEFSEETADALNKLVRTFNNKGWGFNASGEGISANIDYLGTMNDDSVFGIKFRASGDYIYEENLNKANLSIQFSFEYYDIQKQLNILYRELNINPKDYAGSLERRLEFGNILQSKIENNPHLLTPAAKKAIERLNIEFKNTVGNLNRALDNLIQKELAKGVKNPDKKTITDAKNFKHLIFRDLTNLEDIKLASRQKSSNPLLNYKVFEKGIDNSLRELVITPAKPSLGTAATVVISDKVIENAPVKNPSVATRKIGIKPNRIDSVVSSLNGLTLIGSKELQTQVDDVLRMLGSGVKINPTEITNKAEASFVLGYFEDNIITLNKLMPVSGVVYHEAFHAVFRLALTNEERIKYLEAAKSILGSYKTDSAGNKYLNVRGETIYLDDFRRKRNYAGVADDIIVDYIYEEYLADGFRDYKLDKIEPKSKLIKMLYSLLDGLINLFKSRAYKEAKREINKLYDRIDSGEYADVVGDKYQAPRAYALSNIPNALITVGDDVKMDYKQVDNYTTEQLVDRLTREMLKRSGSIIKGNNKSFNEVYDEVTKELINYFNVRNFITDDNPNVDEIISTYEPMFRSMRFMMGAAHRSDINENFILDNLTDDSSLDNYSFSDIEGADAFSYQVYEDIKALVKKSYESVGLIKETTSEEDQTQRDESDENEDDFYFERNDEDEVGENYDDAGILTYKPYQGSIEFQKLIKYIKYQFTDERLGITFDKMVNSREVINQIRKITYNTPKENIVQALYEHVQYLKTQIDNLNESGLLNELGRIPEDALSTIDHYNTLKAVYETLDEQANLHNFLPTRSEGTPFYNMFVNVFYRANKNISSVSISTKYEEVSKDDRKDFDRTPVKNSFYVNSLIERHNTKIVLQNFRTFLNIGLEAFKLRSNLLLYARLKNLVDNYNYIIPTNQETFDYEVNRLYTITSYANLNIPRNVIEFAVAASVRDAYAEKAPFVNSIINQNEKFITGNNYFDIQNFVDLYKAVLNTLNKKQSVRTSAINTFVEEYEKIVPFHIKYDPSLVSNTVLNQDNKPINQSIPYVPSVQILNEIRWKGLRETLLKYYGDLSFFNDNPILSTILSNSTFNPNDKSQLAIDEDTARIFFENFDISIAGGMFQEFGKGNRRQSTYRTLGDKGYALSVLGLFANRTSIKGNYNQDIILFEKPITQLEATSSQFNMTALYDDYTSKKARASKVKSKLKNIIRQEYNRIAREWAQRNDKKLRFENYNCSTQGKSVSTSDLNLRAYNFNRLKGFFTRDAEYSYVNENDNTIDNLHSILRNAAMQGKNFEDLLSETYYDINNNASEYTIDAVLSEALFDYGEEQIADLAEYFKSLDIQIDDIPSGYTINGEYTSLTKYDKVVEIVDEERKEKFYYSKDKTAPLKNAFIVDFGYNFWLNSLEMNQLFDGDLAVGIKNVVSFFKRQKSGVISGNNYRNINIQELDDNTVFAVFSGISAFLDSSNPGVPLTTDKTIGGDREVKLADGQAWTSIDRRIKKFRKDGILSPELEAIIKKLRYTALSEKELDILHDNGIFLGSDKPAVGHPYFYYKDSEHYINRSDSSFVLDEDRVAELYDELDALNINNPTFDSDALARHKEIIKEIHSYFVPKLGRAFHHHLLNALEYYRVDVAFDDTVAKKALVQPLVIDINLLENNILTDHGSMNIYDEEIPIINEDGYINLGYNAHAVNNELVYEQVSTTGISGRTTDSIQKKLLLPAQLDSKKFPGVKKMLDLQLEIVKSRLQLLERLFKTDDPKTLITRAIQEGLIKQGAGENILKFYSLDSNGKNKFNLNLPILGKQPMFYYFSLFNNSIFGPKVAGKKFYHVSAAGYQLIVDENDKPIPRKELDKNPDLYKNNKRRYPTVKEVYDDNGNLVEYNIEVIIPRTLASSREEVEFFERIYTDFLAARIPTADKRSMVRARVVDFIDASYGNSIIVPSQVHFWAGSDMDIDTLYAEVYDYYRNALGKLVKYGEYDSYTKLGLDKKNAEFIEYLHYMANDPVFSDLIDSEQSRINSDEEFKTRSLKNAVGLFGGQVKEFFTGVEDTIVTRLLNNENFKELSKGKSVTVSIETTGNKGKKKATSLESLGELMSARVISPSKEVANMLKLMDRLIAVVNVINRYNLPSTPDALSTFTKEQGNPVHSKLHNDILAEKLNILGNPEVYETYIKNADGEKYIGDYANDKEMVKNISEFSKINESDPYLFQTVSRVRSSNNGTLDSVGPHANFIKASTLISTSNVRLSKDFTFNFIYNGSKIDTNKPSEDAVQKTGGATDVAVDDATHQLLVPLRISKANSGTVGAMYVYGYPSQFARLINSVDLISSSLKEYSLNDDPSYSRSISFRMGFPTFLNNKTLALVNEIANKNAFQKLGILKPSKNKISKFEIDHSKITIEFNDITSPVNGNTLDDFNITVKNNKGELITGQLGSIVLLSFYNEFSKIGNALAFKISKVTDVNKKLKPSFRTLSAIKKAVAFIEDNEIFENAPDIFKQYPYLERLSKTGINEMSTRSKEVLLDETNLFNAFTSLFRYDKSVNIEDVVIELKSILALSSLNAYVKSRINEIDEDNMSSEDTFIKAIHDATNLSYWENNKIEKDLNILKRKFPKNEFLRSLTDKPALVTGRGKTKVITSLIAGKLSIENQNRVINDFYQLLSDSDEAVYKMVVNIAVHGIVKDGGISRNEGFLKIVAPELFIHMSRRLDLLQDKLYKLDTQKGMTSAKYVKGLNDVFKEVYMLSKTSKETAATFTNDILTKLVSTLTQDSTGNSAIRLSFFEGNEQFLPGKYSDIPLPLLKSIVDTILPKNAEFIYTTERVGRITKLVSVRTGLNTSRGLRASKTRFEFWKADANNELLFDLGGVTDTNREVVNRLLLPQGIYQTRNGNYSFPLYQINNFYGDQVFLLTELDGKPFTSEFFANLFDSYKSTDEFEFLLRGTTAKYKVIERQGADRISPNAFDNTVGKEIKNLVESTSKIEDSSLNIIQPLPASVKLVEGTTNLKVTDKTVLNNILGSKYTRNNQLLSISSAAVRYSARAGKVYMDGKLLVSQQLNEFANKLGFSSFEEASKNSEFNDWLSNKTSKVGEYWLVPYTSEALNTDITGEQPDSSETKLFGLNNEYTSELEFHTNTLNVVSSFLDSIGVEQRLVPEFLTKDGSIIQGAIAAANFLEGTVDIIEEAEKRPAAWNKMPEEAAHWWYRLLKQNTELKNALWDSARTAERTLKLIESEYGELYVGSDVISNLREEAVGQLIAEAIKRIEEKNGAPEDYSFLKKFLQWVNKLLAKFKLIKIQEDIFDIAAMKILSSDLTDLMTLSEYRNLTKNIKAQIHSGEVFDEDELDKTLRENLVDKNKYVYRLDINKDRDTDFFDDPFGYTIGQTDTPLKNIKIKKIEIATKAYYVIDDPADILGFNNGNRKFATRKEAKDFLNKKFASQAIETFRKNNPKLDIALDRYRKQDLLLLKLKNGKKGVFVKNSSNSAFKDFYYFLDYKNKIIIGRNSYYFLTDKFEADTQKNLIAKKENIIARKKAAKEGRYTINPVKNPRLSPRLKQEFLQYVEKLRKNKEFIDDFEKSILEAKEKNKKLEAVIAKKLAERSKVGLKSLQADSPEIRKSAINSLIDQLFDQLINNPEAQVDNSNVETLIKDVEAVLNSLPTLALVNMNLNNDGFITSKMLDDFEIDYMSDMIVPFDEDIFTSSKDPYYNNNSGTPYLYSPNVNVSASLPTSEEYQEEIEKVNKQIINNTYDNYLKPRDITILNTIKPGLGDRVKYKSKGIAVLIEVYSNTKGPYSKKAKRARNFFLEYQRRRAFSQYEIAKKLQKAFQNEYGESANIVQKIHSLKYSYSEAFFTYQELTNTSLGKGINVPMIDLSQYGDKEFIELIGLNAGKFIYDMARYSPELSLINNMINKFFDFDYTTENYIEILGQHYLDMIESNKQKLMANARKFNYSHEQLNRQLERLNSSFNNITYSTNQELKFMAVYAALITKQGFIFDKLQQFGEMVDSETPIENLIEAVFNNNFSNSTLNILNDKLNNLYEYIKAKDTLSINLNRAPHVQVYSDHFGDAIQPGLETDIENAILFEYPINRLNDLIYYAAQDNNGILTIDAKTLPEGLYLGNVSALNLPNVEVMPTEFKFSHRLNNLSIPNVKLQDLPSELRDYVEQGNFYYVKLADYEKKAPEKRNSEIPVKSIEVSASKSILFSKVKPKYNFGHTANLYYSNQSFPYYTLGMDGTKFRVEFGATDETFPKELYEKFRLQHGVMKLIVDKPLGWFSGVFQKKSLFITEIQSDLLQNTFQLSDKWLDKHGYSANHPFRKYASLKSKLENYYDGWLYIFTGTGLNMMLSSNPEITKIFIPTSDYYENNVSKSSPYQYYDKIAALYPSAIKTEDGKFWEINRSDIYADNTNKNIKSYYDTIIKAAVIAGVKAQKEATPDLDSDRRLAEDTLSELYSLDLTSEYLKSEEGIQHAEEIKEWIESNFSSIKPFNDDTPGGEFQLVDPQGNIIDDQTEEEEDELLKDLIEKPKKVKLDTNQLLDDLSKAIQDKDIAKQNFIKRLLDEANGFGNSDILYGLNKKVSTPKEKPQQEESEDDNPFC